MAPAYTFCIPDEVHMKTQHAQRARLLILATALIVSYGYAASAYAANGTELSVIASVDNATPACSNTAIPVTIDVTVISTGSTAPASLYISTDGSTFTSAGTINETDWTGAGRTKTAIGTITITLSGNAPTIVEVRAIQPGSNGNPNKKASAPDVTITPSCGNNTITGTIV